MIGRTGLRGALLALAVLVLSSPIYVVPAAAAGRRPDPVTVSVDDVTPTTPAITAGYRLLTVMLTLTNTTGLPIDGVHVSGERGAPIMTQSALDAVLAQKSSPSPSSGLPFPAVTPVTVNLPADGSVDVTFRTRTSTQDPQLPKGICLCAQGAVYPLYFYATGTAAVGQVGSGVTLLPSFDTPPERWPVKVAWVWPLIDRPHRLVSDTIFTDDALADSVRGGRLDRSLSVLEQVVPQVPITLVVDPELLDELDVMATTNYQYSVGSRLVAGLGRAAAANWLVRFQAVVAEPDVQVVLTPYADPDVQSLAPRGIHWATTLPTAMQTRVTAALGGKQPASRFAWPAAGTLDPSTLAALHTTGTTSILLDSEAASTATDGNGVPRPTVRLRTAGGTVAAALIAPAIRTDLNRVLGRFGTGAAALPDLSAELAIRAAQGKGTTRFVVLAPQRYIDPAVGVAVRAILQTSRSVFTTPVNLLTALRSETPRTATSLRQASPADQLSPALLTNLHQVAVGIPTVTSLISSSANAAPLVAGWPLALQRLKSSAWRTGTGGAPIGLARSVTVEGQLDSIRDGIQIVPPSSGRYTLASSNSPLPITVTNRTNYSAEFDVEVRAAANLPGFTADRLIDRRIAARSKQTLSVVAQVQYSGTIKVEAQLRTTSNQPLGHPVSLYVHSTVLGLIGVVITSVAGIVLALALLIRFLRLIRRRALAGRGQ